MSHKAIKVWLSNNGTRSKPILASILTVFCTISLKLIDK